MQHLTRCVCILQKKLCGVYVPGRNLWWGLMCHYAALVFHYGAGWQTIGMRCRDGFGVWCLVRCTCIISHQSCPPQVGSLPNVPSCFYCGRPWNEYYSCSMEGGGFTFAPWCITVIIKRLKYLNKHLLMCSVQNDQVAACYACQTQDSWNQNFRWGNVVKSTKL